MFKLNKDQLLKQQRQVINNAYTHVSYLLKECRPFLKGYIKGEYGLLRTDKRLLFQTLPKKNDNGTLLPIQLDLSTSGPWCVFPAGELDIEDDRVILDTELPAGLSKPQLINIILNDAIANEKMLSIYCIKAFTLEYKMFKSIESSLKNTFNNMFHPSRNDINR